MSSSLKEKAKTLVQIEDDWDKSTDKEKFLKQNRIRLEDAKQELKQKLLKFLDEIEDHCHQYSSDYKIFEGKKKWKGYCHKDLEEKIERFKKEMKL
jgi:hypothetical protein